MTATPLVTVAMNVSLPRIERFRTRRRSQAGITLAGS